MGWIGECGMDPAVVCSDELLKASIILSLVVMCYRWYCTVLGMSKRLWKELLLHLPRPKQKGQILAVYNGTLFKSASTS